MEILTSIIGGFGLAAPAGLNAWLCLLIVGLLARFTTIITLQPPFTLLTDIWVLVALGVLLTIEVFADKIPAVDTVNDIIHTFIRPVAGGILFASYTGAVGGLDPTIGFILGLLAAGSVHAVKATTRPMITATTGGLANPLVSLVEDIIAGATTVLALFAAPCAALLMALLLGGAIFFVWRWRERRRRRQALANVNAKTPR
ncbi:MAG TPA: DUF4126 domain-containing protein [Chloroflexia bacterium]|nr:DUF4126 domain-containing protein [Chloroflexia bacterium]